MIMIIASRAFLQRCFTSTRGRHAVLCINNGSFQFTQKLNFCTGVKLKCRPSAELATVDDYSGRKWPYSQRFYRIVTLIQESKKQIAYCVPVIEKMRFIFQNQRHDARLYVELNQFIMSPKFTHFCKHLEQNLPRFQPDAFIIFLHLADFGVPENSILMQKILTLILDNINNYSPYDKVFIFALMSGKNFKGPKAEDLKKALEFYMENIFEKDIQYCKPIKEVKHLINNQFVPLKVKKIIAEVTVDNLISGSLGRSFTSSMLIGLVDSVLRHEVPLLSRAKTCSFLEKFLSLKSSYILDLLKLYIYLLQRDDSYYNEKFCNNFAEKILIQAKSLKLLNLFLKLGYLHDNLIKSAVEKVFSGKFQNVNAEGNFLLASTLARCCAFERDVLSAETWEAIKLEFNLMDHVDHSVTPTVLSLCQFLTFLGCETRNLFSRIFENVGNMDLEPDLIPLVLRLHHLAKAYYSESFPTLSDEILTKCVEELAATNKSSPSDLINFIGGENYLLRNCTTPDKHLLHHVAVLGGDNKPIDLSYVKRNATSFKDHLYDIKYIERPPGSKLVVFQNFTDKQPVMFRNAPVMSGMARIFLKTFEGLNCDIVLLPNKFYRASSEENLEYLSSQLNEIIRKHNEK